MKFGFEIDVTFHEVAVIEKEREHCKIKFTFGCDQVLTKQGVTFLIKNSYLGEQIKIEAVKRMREVKEELMDNMKSVYYIEAYSRGFNGNIYLESAKYIKGHGSIVHLYIDLSDPSLDFESLVDSVKFGKIVC